MGEDVTNMEEMELIRQIEDSLNKGTYDELLCVSELKLKNLFERYIPKDILVLINKTILFHNYNLTCKEMDYSNYQKDKHNINLNESSNSSSPKTSPHNLKLDLKKSEKTFNSIYG